MGDGKVTGEKERRKITGEGDVEKRQWKIKREEEKETAAAIRRARMTKGDAKRRGENQNTGSSRREEK